MSKEHELLKKAVKGLLETRVTDISTKHKFLIDEIEELLAQPEQEPVAWMSINSNGGKRIVSIDSYYADHKNYMPLYLAPPKQEPLSPTEIIFPEWIFTKDEQQAFIAGFRLAEREHGIRVQNE